MYSAAPSLPPALSLPPPPLPAPSSPDPVPRNTAILWTHDSDQRNIQTANYSNITTKKYST
nr:p8.6 protein=Ig beta homolog/B29 protein homolog/lymphocyte antigen receptor signaling protein [mice, C57BL/6, liver, Peptide, 60 aa] [Mus sp.]